MRVTVLYDIEFKRTYRKCGIVWHSVVSKRRSFECDAETRREALRKFRSGHRQYQSATVTVVDIKSPVGLPNGDFEHVKKTKRP